MKCLVIGGIEIRAEAVSYGVDGFVSVVTVKFAAEGGRPDITSSHEWLEPMFSSEAQALEFAWRRATAMARSLCDTTA